MMPDVAPVGNKKAKNNKGSERRLVSSPIYLKLLQN